MSSGHLLSVPPGEDLLLKSPHSKRTLQSSLWHHRGHGETPMKERLKASNEKMLWKDVEFSCLCMYVYVCVCLLAYLCAYMYVHVCVCTCLCVSV